MNAPAGVTIRKDVAHPNLVHLTLDPRADGAPRELHVSAITNRAVHWQITETVDGANPVTLLDLGTL